MSSALLLVVVVACALLSPADARAAAILIPDQTSRLGSCGGPEGPDCTWACGAGRSCSADGKCALHGEQAFGAVLSVQVDDTPCGASPGSVMRLGLASAGGTPFQLSETAWDLCARDVTCTGRETRVCGSCAEPNGCFSDGGDGEYPCPPGPVIFFCSDPCGGGAPHLEEGNFFDLTGWLRESVQPLPEIMRAQLPSPPAAGRPVIYHAEFPVVASDDPPAARVCVRVAYTSQDRPLSVCSNDTTRSCTTDADCKKGTCESGTPPGVNPAAPDTTVSGSTCAGPGADAGRPCTAGADCDSGICTPLPATATSFCDASGAPCDLAPCPGGETCITCPDPACGDGILDPDEACDLGPFGPGNGCDASCQVESCFVCDGQLGEPSSCFQLTSGEPCDLDGRPCTVDTCDFSGTCQPGGAPGACAGALPGKTKIKVKRDETDPAKAKLKWKWTSAAPFDVGALGFPNTLDELAVCAYDQSGPVFEAAAPPGGDCAGTPCWTLTDVKVRYKDKEATPHGLTGAKAKSGDAGKGKIVVQGKGENLAAPTLPLAPPVRVLLLRGDGPLCWEASYPSPAKNDPAQFKATN